jgi:hypothetical protein
MSSTLLQTIANFETTISAKLTAAGASLVLTSNLDKDGVAIPSGVYGFTLDEGKVNEEHIIGTLSGSTLTITIRNVSRQDGTTAGTGKTHRKGASIKITNHPLLVRIRRILDGTDGFNGAVPVHYDVAPTFTPGSQQLVTVAYADALVGAGVADATNSTKGKVKLSLAAADVSQPIAVGDNDPRLSNTSYYAADAGITDAYAVTLAPAPTAYTAGMVVNFKANTVNTGPATLNVNGLGAKTIVKNYNVTLGNGDIKAGQLVSVIYDGTNFQLLSQVTPPAYKSGTTTKTMNDANTVVTIAHGLGAIPSKIRLTAILGSSSTTAALHSYATGVYDGTTTSSMYMKTEVGAAVYSGVSATDILIIGTTGNDSQRAVATFDATNITLTWTKNGVPPTGTAQILWEAFA